MPVLKNVRHERFAQEYAAGKTAVEAYVLAGYKAHKANPQRLRETRDVKERIGELLARPRYTEARAVERAIERTAITKTRVIEELAKIAFANMADYTRVVGSDRVVDLSNATRDQMAAVQEITVEDYMDGRGEDAREVGRVKFKLADKQTALFKIGVELGMFVQRSDNRHRHEIPFSQLPPEQREAKAKELIDRAKRLLALRDERKAHEAAVIEDVSPKSEDEDAPPR